MKHEEFLDQVEESKILAAIQAAEQLTTGEIRVCVTRAEPEAVTEAALAKLYALGMERTRQRNGVLLYFAPSVQRFAIVGDIGIHSVGGDVLWTEAVEAMTPYLRTGDLTRAILVGIELTARALQQHFPLDGKPEKDGNELPDDVVQD